jgi:hypothetical protein
MTSNANLKEWPRARSAYSAPTRPKCYRHPLYDEYFGKWHRYELAYDGGEEARSAFLLPHERERDSSYRARLERAVYPNHIEVVVATYASHLFRQQVSRSAGEGDSEELNALWEDIDNDDSSAGAFFDDVARLVQVYGGIGILVDRFEPTDQPPATRAQERASGRRPYARMVRPQDVVDWQPDGEGGFEWVVIREAHRAERTFDQPYGRLEWRYRRWTAVGWELYRVEEIEDDEDEDDVQRYRYVLEDEGEHPVGYVPFHTVHWGDKVDGAWFGRSAVRELVPMVARLVNHISLMDEQIAQHTFSILQVPFSTWEELEKVEFAVTGAIPRPDDAQGCEYLSPDVSQIQVIQDQVEATEQAIRYLSGVGRQNDNSRQAQSGLALAYQNADKRALIESFGGDMEQLEVKVAETGERWMEREPGDIAVNYRVEVTPEEIDSAIRDALQFDSLDIGGEAALENRIQAVKAHLGRYVSQERLDEILEDLRSGDSGGTGVDSYRVTNALRAGGLAPTPGLVRALHQILEMPEPSDQEATEQAEILSDVVAAQRGPASEQNDE